MDELEARIDALERAVTDGDHDLSELAAEGETRERLAAVETEVGDLADRVAELEAATQALRGYVGNVRAVNREVEQRADAALAKAESVESAIVGDHSGDRPGRDQLDDGPETTAPSDEPTGVGPDGHSPGPHGAPTTADTATHGQSDRQERTGQSTTAGSTADGHGGPDHHGRCAACGRPTGNGTDGETHPFAGSNGNGTEAGETAPGGDRADAAGGTVGGNGTATGRAEVGKNGDGRTDDPLEGVFEADEPERGDNGAFDRIREML
jgi:hypothetical protein